MATGSSGSCSTLLKFSHPTHVAGRTRLVCWNDMVTVRTIGYQEKAPKANSMGSRKTRVVRPLPLTQLAGVRRGRRVGPVGAILIGCTASVDTVGAEAGCPSGSSPATGRSDLVVTCLARSGLAPGHWLPRAAD